MAAEPAANKAAPESTFDRATVPDRKAAFQGKAAAEQKVPPESNVKETVESILVAFILAFIFRAFVVEAFVIPTGSMAPTLYGAHMRFRCPDCGNVFDVGYSVARRGSHGEDTDIPSIARRPIDYHCPNCGFTFPGGETQRVRFGDRILVLKYLYLFQKPQRGDTVVFKSPSEDDHNAEDPDYSVNFIKRLIGVGPESIVLLDGDVYVGPFGSRDPAAYHIWRKPDHVQNVLWRSVYDNDFIPHYSEAERSGSPTWKQPWSAQSAQSGWDLGVGGRSRIFNFNAPAAGAISFDPDANPRNHSLTDYLVYDETEHRGWDPRPVTDLKLACTYIRKSGDGPLQLQLTKSIDCFTARISAGKLALVHSQLTSPGTFSTGSEEVIAEKPLAALQGSASARIELSNVDYRVTVRVNDEAVITYDYNPDVPTLWARATLPGGGPMDPFAQPMVRITAAGQQCSIEHVQLFRDIYYLNSRSGMLFWGSPGKPADLRAGEYFVLGDNSFISGDARYWSDPIVLPKEGMNYVESGRVPEQFMLGKAFFVYWPAGYSLPGTDRVNIVPDFGDMRFIH